MALVNQSVDILFLAYNRLAFTQKSFEALLENTDWQYVQRLSVYDDGSVDGTREWLKEAVKQVPVTVAFRDTRFRSAVRSQRYWIATATTPLLAKCDCDAVFPPGWLASSLDVMDRHPELSLLGIEAMYACNLNPQVKRNYTSSRFISGLGVYRREAWRGDMMNRGRYWGLEEWQLSRTDLTRGWINPSLPVILLDRIPLEPWKSLSAEYIKKGWQRPVEDKALYGMDRSDIWTWRFKQ